MPHKNKHTRQRHKSVDPYRSQEPYLKKQAIEGLTSNSYDQVTRERLKYDFRYGNDYEVHKLRFKRDDVVEEETTKAEESVADTEAEAPSESVEVVQTALPADTEPAPAPGPAPAPAPPSQPKSHVQYLTPLYGITAFFGALFIFGPLLVRKGPHKEIVRACIMMTAFCCWIFWVTIYFGQMNAIMGPRLDNTTVAWMAYKWGQVSVSVPAPVPAPTTAAGTDTTAAGADNTAAGADTTEAGTDTTETTSESAEFFDTPPTAPLDLPPP